MCDGKCKSINALFRIYILIIKCFLCCRPAPSPEPIIVKLEDETTESESIELYIQNPSNDSFSQDPGGDSLGEFDPDLSNDDSMSMEHGQPNSTMDDQSQGEDL